MSFSHPAWSYSSNIYEVNIRQYTEEGTFKAFSKHLKRLRDMNVEILWFMPITPISIRGRKGALGSYYAASDHYSINPEFGTIEDFVELVKDAQALGFKVIIDWVANHTGNDHHWVEQHPAYYQHDENGEIVHPNDWSDVSHLDFENEDTRVAMIEAMKFWIRQADIDGFRCDMAHLVPLDFWFRARTEIDAVKPGLFWLAECEEPNYHNAFDATYTWEWMHATEKFYQREISLSQLIAVLEANHTRFFPDAFRVYFTSNHDENSWNGTEFEKYREMVLLFAVFSCTWNGLPMIYSGQELPNYKRLKFFEKDLIEWQEKFELHDFYKTLLDLKKRNPALLAGSQSSTEWLIDLSSEENIIAYKRKNGDDEVIVCLNFSEEEKSIQLTLQGMYIDIFSGEKKSSIQLQQIKLDSWSFKVLELTKP